MQVRLAHLEFRICVYMHVKYLICIFETLLDDIVYINKHNILNFIDYITVLKRTKKYIFTWKILKNNMGCYFLKSYIVMHKEFNSPK